VLRFKPLPFLDRIRLGLMVIRARTVRDWRQLDRISVEDWVRRTAGSRVYEVVWKPLLHGKFGPLSSEISAAWLWSKLVDRGGSRNPKGHELLGYVRGGLGRMFDRLVAEIERMGGKVHLSSPVLGLVSNGERVSSIHTDRGSFETDLVVAGAQVPDLCRLLPEDQRAYAAELSRIKFLGNVCLVLILPERLSEFYWTNVMEPGAPFVGIVEQTNWVDPADLDHKRLVYISAYCSEADPRFRMNAPELLDLYLPWIRKLFPAFDPAQVERAYVWFAEFAQPVVTTGYSSLVPGVRTPLNNLFLCTMAQIYPQDRQVSNGIRLARQVAGAASIRLQEARP
jgi:protoporphyrinogen oxidase